MSAARPVASPDAVPALLADALLALLLDRTESADRSALALDKPRRERVYAEASGRARRATKR